MSILEQLTSTYKDESFLRLAKQLAGDGLGSLRDITEVSQEFGNIGNKIERIDIGSRLDSPDVVGIAAIECDKTLIQRGFKSRRRIAEKVLTHLGGTEAVIAFYDSNQPDDWRLGLIRGYPGELDTLREFQAGSHYAARTAREQLQSVLDLNSDATPGERATKLNEAFSLEAVSQNFYDEFKGKHFEPMKQELLDAGEDEDTAWNFVLLFCIRILFLGFVQKKGWLGDKENFLKEYLYRYQQSEQTESFYKDWLEPLFFEALSQAPGAQVAYSDAYIPGDLKGYMQHFPYLNGGLFKRGDIDRYGLKLSDTRIQEFFTFIFSYNFTIIENTVQEQSLELNPELLGIIFERLVNKSDGAVYTPRTEVNFMCRMSLLQWLKKNQTTEVDDTALYELFFREQGNSQRFNEDQKTGSFSERQSQDLLRLLKQVSICDPAVGSGAFPVGMLHVIEEIEEELHSKLQGKRNEDESFERRKTIIQNSLYGVEVKQWAVWICQLRLWLALFVDAPDELKDSFDPILPSLDFKMQHGDSLVQHLGMVQVSINAPNALPAKVKRQITDLMDIKEAYFYNQGNYKKEDIDFREQQLYRRILEVQCHEKQQKLADIQQPEHQQITLEGNIEQPTQTDLQAQHKKELESELEKINSALQHIKEHSRFVWNIGFAEIFGEKGGFDIIIGNPPYIRQEEISDPLEIQPDAKQYKYALAETIRQDWWPYVDFNTFKRRSGYSARSDLSVYFYLHSLKLLNNTGIHTFICSNSWLDVDYGSWLQQFLLERAPIKYIFDNHARRSFGSADINTIISVIDAPVHKKATDYQFKFVAFKKPFEEVVLTEHLVDVEHAEETIKTDLYRVFPVQSKTLIKESTENGKYIGEKWGGKYLRAPDIFFTILEKGGDKLVELKDIADIRRGITTGANDFFYLQVLENRGNTMLVRNGTGWEGEIESEFLNPVIKSPRECDSITVDPEQLPHRVFLCNKTKDELRKTKALEYIEWGEKHEVEIRQGSNKGKKITGYQNLSTIKGRKYWWSLDSSLGNMFWVKETNDVLATYTSEEPILADCRLYYGKGDEKMKSYVNSTLFYLFSETMTRSGLGLGARSLMVYEVNNLFCFNQELLLQLNLPRLEKRETETIYEECGIDPDSDTPIATQIPRPFPDRVALDKVIFDAIGLNEAERADVYRAVCQLVYDRLNKAQSV